MSASPIPSGPENIDWEWIASQVEPEEIRIQTSSVPPPDGWWMKAIAKLRKESLAGVAASLMRTQVKAQYLEWFEAIRIRAASEKVPFETLFVRLISGDESFDKTPSRKKQLEIYARELKAEGYTVRPPDPASD